MTHILCPRCQCLVPALLLTIHAGVTAADVFAPHDCRNDRHSEMLPTNGASQEPEDEREDRSEGTRKGQWPIPSANSATGPQGPTGSVPLPAGPSGPTGPTGRRGAQGP
jgi:hypothetical protein